MKKKEQTKTALKKVAVSPQDKKVKHRNEITKCPHVDGIYYASGMCKNCYHSKGRIKLATLCEHTDRKLYARGICKACYLREYHNRVKFGKDPAQAQNLPKTEKATENGKQKEVLQKLPLFDGSDRILTQLDASHDDDTFGLDEPDTSDQKNVLHPPRIGKEIENPNKIESSQV